VTRIAYPRDSTYPRLDTLAAAANLAFTPVSGGARGSRLEFVAYDVDGDGATEPSEGFARIFDAAAGGYGDTTRLRASPTIYSFFGMLYHSWNDPIVQNQCGAFYQRAGRWHFIPVSTHRRGWVRALLTPPSSGYPAVSNGDMDHMDDNDDEAVRDVLSQETARCFPAGSPFLMPAERFTNASGVVTGTSADIYPWGVRTPPSGWPASGPYGGSDSTFTIVSRNCPVGYGATNVCAGTIDTVGRWRAFPGTPISSAPDSVMQATERPYLWPIGSTHNPARVASWCEIKPVRQWPVAGPIRSGRRARRHGRLTYVREPNDPSAAACTDILGVLATRDVLVVNGLTSRVRRIYSPFGTSFSGMLGGEPRFTMHGNFMSLTGTVGTESSPPSMGSGAAQLPCPDNGGGSTDSNGGCLAVTGGMVMQMYSQLYNGTDTGFRYYGTSDRCQTTTRRPPFFPLRTPSCA
jgi:hypothetical protein